MTRIGIFSGTFDPVHHGHIAFCQAARQTAGLDRVVLLPEPNPRHKPHRAPLQHRLAMLQLAVQQQPGLEVCRLPGRFTVERTLPQLLRMFPQDELCLLIGSDVVRSLGPQWPGLQQLLETVEIVVGLRASDTQRHIEHVLAALQTQFPQTPIRVSFVASQQARLASTGIRRALPGVSVGLAPPVADYIAANQLYVATSA